MKNIARILPALIYIALVSCGNTGTSNKDTTEIKPVRRMMWKTLNDDLIIKYPNVLNNDLVREKAIKELMVKVDSLVPLHYLEDIPLKVHNVEKNPHGIGALTQFYADNSLAANKNEYTNILQFDIVGLMSEELASTIDDKKKYFIYAHNYKRLNSIEADVLLKSMYYSPVPRISHSLYGDGMEINIGMFLCEIDSIKLIDEQ